MGPMLLVMLNTKSLDEMPGFRLVLFRALCIRRGRVLLSGWCRCSLTEGLPDPLESSFTRRRTLLV